MIPELTPQTPTLDATLFDQLNLVSDPFTIEPRLARILIRYWFFALQFDTLLPTKPIMLLQGAKGSGKSSFFAAVGHIYHGPLFKPFALPSDQKDFDAICAARNFVVWDNVDDKPDKWFQNRLAMLGTGGAAPKRALYTDGDLANLVFNCFVGLTARTPRFTRDDIADRLLIFSLDRLERFRSESSRLADVAAARPAIWHEIIAYDQWILRAFAATPANSRTYTSRMADFADFAWRLASYAGPDAQEDHAAAFDSMAVEQATFTLQSNPLLEYITLWLKESINQYRKVSSNELCAELRELVPHGTKVYLFDDNRAFGRSLINQMPALKEFFEIAIVSNEHNIKHYTIGPKT